MGKAPQMIPKVIYDVQADYSRAASQQSKIC